jgi:localization factor PodJL
MVQDMNRAMAWNIADAERRTRAAAADSARRAGMRLDDWIDEAIADYAALGQHEPPQQREAEDDRLDAAAGRLEQIARRNSASTRRAPPRRSSDPLSSIIDRIEDRLARAEAQAARAFETVAQILERDDAARDSDRRALIDAVRRLESVRATFTGATQTVETGGDHLPPSKSLGPKPSFDLKAAVSRVAMRRHELEERASHQGTGVPHSDSRATAFADSSSLPDQPAASLDSGPEMGSLLSEGASDSAAALSQSLLDDIRTLALKVDAMRRERADQTSIAVDLSSMRAEIDAMSRSLADLAPRNAVVALEGAIGDLVQRVEMLRKSGYGESMLAPLEAVAAEFRVALKAHDPQAAAAGLAREIRMIGDKIDSLAAAAIKPEAFELIRRQTEEVRNLLASAALRTPPLERLERQIGELADRIERLGASPAPHSESAEMAVALAEACRQIERSIPPAALATLERRLEQIATRLDQEIARPQVAAAINPGAFEDLARQIDGVRQLFEQRPPATIDTGPIERLLREFDDKLAAAGRPDADMQALRSIFVEISHKLDRLADREIPPELDARPVDVASPVDVSLIETLLRSLEAKLEVSGAASVDREVVEQIADEVARRLHDASSRQIDLRVVAQQIDTIYDRIDALATKDPRPDDPQPVMQQLLEKLREADRAEGSSASINAALGAHLAELKAEQTNADQRTQSRLASVQSILETLAARLASIETELAADDLDEELRPPFRPTGPSASVSSTSLSAEAVNDEGALQRPTQPETATNAQDLSLRPESSEDVLIEPGAGAPRRAREARELAQMIGPKTNPAVTAHIAAARRAAQAMAENNAAQSSDDSKILTDFERAPFAARSLQAARALYGNHRRAVLLSVALALVATLAVRMVGVRAPFLQHYGLDGQAVKSADVGAPKGKPADAAGVAKSGGEAIDVAPTASIAPPPTKPDVSPLTPQNSPPVGVLLAAIPPGISPSLRGAVAARVPNAQYELATRLFDGRELPKDQPAAAHWFECAASAGLAPAAYRLGSMYEKGIGVARDAATAKAWYLKAAEAGNARAAHNLAVMNAEPSEGAPNYSEALKWFRKAAELGVRDSQYNLAILYTRGLGVEKNLSQSWLWFALAAQQGDADAGAKRDEVAREMDPVSLAAAIVAFQKFKAAKPDPAANEVSAPPGGWDPKTGSSSLDGSPPPGDPAHPQAPL